LQKRTYSGLKAGIVQRSISYAFHVLTEFNAVQSWLSNKAIVLHVSLSFLLGIAVLVSCIGLVIFGAILGMIFVRLEGSIPIASIYIKAPFFYAIIWLLTNAYAWTSYGIFNVPEFIWDVIAALVFAFLFNRWTK